MKRDDRRTRLQFGGRDRLGLRRLNDLDRRVDLAGALFALFDLEGEAELGAELARDVLFQRLAGAGENVHLHQVMDDLVRLEAELGREVLDDDRRLDDDDLVLELLCGDGLLVERQGPPARPWRPDFAPAQVQPTGAGFFAAGLVSEAFILHALLGGGQERACRLGFRRFCLRFRCDDRRRCGGNRNGFRLWLCDRFLFRRRNRGLRLGRWRGPWPCVASSIRALGLAAGSGRGGGFFVLGHIIFQNVLTRRQAVRQLARGPFRGSAWRRRRRDRARRRSGRRDRLPRCPRR